MDRGPAQRTAIRSYLRVTSALIDLSGRLRYLLFDLLNEVAFEIGRSPQACDDLIAVLKEHKSSVGATIMIEFLFDLLPEEGEQAPRPTPAPTKARILELAGESGETTLLPSLASFAADPATPPELLICTAAAIRRLGIPQEPLPGQDPTLPLPLITARHLARLLKQADLTDLAPAWAARRDEQVAWLDRVAQEGIAVDNYRLGAEWVRPGDWLLMRNPSPYNLFTDLSPGLFTHVGIITDEVGSDGLRRMVMVDLPERGTHIQTTNLDTFVQRTLHYMILRHPDATVARTMADAARDMIGNASEFDLNFRTERLKIYEGIPLADAKIHTYCAGLLLLAAQQTDRPRSEFFAVDETNAGGKTATNLTRMGLSIGKGFASPTGAIFSPQLQIVSRRQPMYEPGREIEEAVFDHFALQLAAETLNQSPDVADALRIKLAEASQTNPLLAKALAGAAGVAADIDLLSAAKAAAVVETLDEVAHSGSEAFYHARTALQAGPADQLSAGGYGPDEIAAIEAYRRRHAELFKKWTAGDLTPRGLRLALVDYYIAKGRNQIDERFFRPEP